jgi:protein-arginine kinase
MTFEDFRLRYPHQRSDETVSSEIHVLSFCSLTRNLADFSFCHRCSAEEKEAVQQRILQAAKTLSALKDASYFPADTVSPVDLLLFGERFLSSYRLSGTETASGVLLSEDQRIALTLNREDHLSIRVLSPQEKGMAVWEIADQVDTYLQEKLGFAFHDKWGYLSPSLHRCGTGLHMVTLLNMPADALVAGRNAGDSAEAQIATLSSGLKLQYLSPGMLPRCPSGYITPAVAELMAPRIEDYPCQSLYPGSSEKTAAPQATLGFYRVLTAKHVPGIHDRVIAAQMDEAADALILREREARKILIERPEFLRDYVRRCLALIAQTHCLGLKEGLVCLSILRLAAETGHLKNCDKQQTDLLLYAMQRAHLALSPGVDPEDPFSLAEERAKRFRTVFEKAALV